MARFIRGISKKLKDSITFMEWKDLHKGTYDLEFFRKPEDRKTLEVKEFEEVTGRKAKKSKKRGTVQTSSEEHKEDKPREVITSEPKGE